MTASNGCQKQRGMTVVRSIDTIQNKKSQLYKYLGKLQSLVVGFSGGVDSSVLLAAAHAVLGDRALAMTATSAAHSRKEMAYAAQMAEEIGAKHIFFETDEMADLQFTSNGPERCYHCKIRLFSTMRKLADELGFETLSHGANLDDLSDYRPGIKAAEELNVVAPLSRIGFTKAQIRKLAKSMGLSSWNRPSMACLATRVPYGVAIDQELLVRIDQAETIVRQAGASHCRVRHHGNIARIELNEAEMAKLMDPKIRHIVTAGIRALGYKFVCMDMEGFESGKMNREL
jgi:uncharacterized protein